MSHTGVRPLAASVLLGAALILGGCTAPTATTPGASATTTTAALSPSTTPPTLVPGPSASTAASTGASPGSGSDLHGTTMGLLRGYDAATAMVSVDVVYFLSGDQAITYIAERPSLWRNLECASGPYAGGSTAGCSLPNDYYIVNENPRVRALPLTPEARISLIPWPDCCDIAPATREALAARAAGQPPLLMSFDVTDDGRISELSEFYTP